MRPARLAVIFLSTPDFCIVTKWPLGSGRLNKNTDLTFKRFAALANLESRLLGICQTHAALGNQRITFGAVNADGGPAAAIFHLN